MKFEQVPTGADNTPEKEKEIKGPTLIQLEKRASDYVERFKESWLSLKNSSDGPPYQGIRKQKAEMALQLRKLSGEDCIMISEKELDEIKENYQGYNEKDFLLLAMLIEEGLKKIDKKFGYEN